MICAAVSSYLYGSLDMLTPNKFDTLSDNFYRIITSITFRCPRPANTM